MAENKSSYDCKVGRVADAYDLEEIDEELVSLWRGEDGESYSEAAARVLDLIEHFEDRVERFHGFVPELRAWGQSPIFAIAWRNLYADLIEQLYEHEWLATHLDRERNARLVEDGIRLSDT